MVRLVIGWPPPLDWRYSDLVSKFLIPISDGTIGQYQYEEGDWTASVRTTRKYTAWKDANSHEVRRVDLVVTIVVIVFVAIRFFLVTITLVIRF